MLFNFIECTILSSVSFLNADLGPFLVRRIVRSEDCSTFFKISNVLRSSSELYSNKSFKPVLFLTSFTVLKDS